MPQITEPDPIIEAVVQAILASEDDMPYIGNWDEDSVEPLARAVITAHLAALKEAGMAVVPVELTKESHHG